MMGNNQSSIKDMNHKMASTKTYLDSLDDVLEDLIKSNPMVVLNYTTSRNMLRNHAKTWEKLNDKEKSKHVKWLLQEWKKDRDGLDQAISILKVRLNLTL